MFGLGSHSSFHCDRCSPTGKVKQFDCRSPSALTNIPAKSFGVLAVNPLAWLTRRYKKTLIPGPSLVWASEKRQRADHRSPIARPFMGLAARILVFREARASGGMALRRKGRVPHPSIMHFGNSLRESCGARHRLSVSSAGWKFNETMRIAGRTASRSETFIAVSGVLNSCVIASSKADFSRSLSRTASISHLLDCARARWLWKSATPVTPESLPKGLLPRSPRFRSHLRPAARERNWRPRWRSLDVLMKQACF